MRTAVVSLDVIQVASPCTVSWDDMQVDGIQGNDRVRHCSQCHLNVYDLSAMSRAEAQAFVNGREGRTCVRFLRREDGTILTQDCPVGLRAVRRRLLRVWTAFAACLTGLIVGMFVNRRSSSADDDYNGPMYSSGPLTRATDWTRLYDDYDVPIYSNGPLTRVTIWTEPRLHMGMMCCPIELTTVSETETGGVEVTSDPQDTSSVENTHVESH